MPPRGPPQAGCAAVFEFRMHYIQNSGNRIINGDCLAVLPQLASGSVDFVLTDPPYLVNYRDRQGRSLAGDSDGQWLKPAFAQIFRVLKAGRYCVSFYGWNKVDQFFAAWRAAGFTPVGHLVWVKHYASSRGLLATYQHEQAYLLAKGTGAVPRLQLPDVLDWQYTGNRFHPTQKPVGRLSPSSRLSPSPARSYSTPSAVAAARCWPPRF